jgi:DNA-binding transcriptional MerR regulator
MTDTPELINRPDAAKFLGVKEGQIRRYEKRGELPVADTQMFGQQRRPLYRKSDLEAIKAKRDKLGTTESA